MNKKHVGRSKHPEPFQMVFPHVIVVCFFKVVFPSDRFPSAGFTPWSKNSYGAFFVRCQLTTTRFTRAFARNRVQSWNDVPRFFPSQESSSIFFTKLSEQSRSGHLKQIFSSQITRIGDGDWSDWLAITEPVRTKPLGRRIHPHSTGDLKKDSKICLLR